MKFEVRKGYYECYLLHASACNWPPKTMVTVRYKDIQSIWGMHRSKHCKPPSPFLRRPGDEAMYILEPDYIFFGIVVPILICCHTSPYFINRCCFVRRPVSWGTKWPSVS